MHTGASNGNTYLLLQLCGEEAIEATLPWTEEMNQANRFLVAAVTDNR
jgi:hypothetical protein